MAAAVSLPLIVGVVFTGAGAVGLVYGLWNLWYATHSTQWPEVPGEIATSDLQRDRDSDGMVTYRAEVAYKYQVAGQQYVADRVFFGDQLSVSWATGAVREVERYQPGNAVQVHFDPRRPGRAVLEPGMRWQTVTLVILGLLFLGIGMQVLLGHIPVNGQRAA
jgi:hypothetical protein